MSDAFDALKNPIFVALDVDDKTLIQKIVRETADLVGGFKIGPRSVFRFGPKIIEEIAEKSAVFMDFKFFDIPSTMNSAVRSAFNAGASFATVHAMAGREALMELAQAEKDLNKQRPFSVLAVTILTSSTEENLPPNLKKEKIESQVKSLAGLTYESGVHGLVCSPHELPSVLKLCPDLKCVTPGIRLPTDSMDDQARTATPQEAIQAGAKAIVIGRSLLRAPDAREYVKNVLASLK